MIVDAIPARSPNTDNRGRPGGYGTQPPLQRFLAQCHEEFSTDNSGALADYIPELTRANPSHFGISVATTDGHVYEIGDSGVQEDEKGAEAKWWRRRQPLV